MTYTTLIAATELQALIASGQPLMVFDCSFDLTSPSAGAQQFAQAHIPGAVYADLDKNLSAKHGAPGAHGTLVAQEADQPASGGRHPLPSRERFAMWLSSVGFSNDMQAVVYDRQGANYCGRLWWMLKWLGHDAVAVLDGGLQAWQAAGGATQTGPARPPEARQFGLREPLRQLVMTQTVAAQLGNPAQTVVDARGAPRYRGDVEPLDPVAGHIPGALNRPFTDNFTPEGRFKSPDQLRQEWQALLGSRSADTVVHHCGSGVSAVPNVLAMEVAGLGRTALYAGSWSEWCNTPGLPCEKS